MLPSARLYTIHSWWTGPSVGRWLLDHGPVVLSMPWYTPSISWDSPPVNPEKSIISTVSSSCFASLLWEQLDLWHWGFDQYHHSSYYSILSHPCLLYTRLGHHQPNGFCWGPEKTFSTCSSHMTVVSLYYGAIIFLYMRPISFHTAGQDKVVCIFYTILTPMLYPMTYSLRYKDVMGDLEKVLCKCSLYSKM